MEEVLTFHYLFPVLNLNEVVVMTESIYFSEFFQNYISLIPDFFQTGMLFPDFFQTFQTFPDLNKIPDIFGRRGNPGLSNAKVVPLCMDFK